MLTLGEEPNNFEEIVAIICIATVSLLFVIEILYLEKMTIAPVYLMPLVSLLFIFENILIIMGTKIQEYSIIAYTGYAAESLIIPLLFMILFETTYILHETRSVQFFCFRFEEDGDWKNPTIKLIVFSLVRLVAAGFFVINFLANIGFRGFDIVKEGDHKSYFDLDSRSPYVWISFIPALIYSVLAIFLSVLLIRYGLNATIGLTTRKKWRNILFCSLGFIVATFFPTNLGELYLIFASAYLIYLVQEDLLISAHFADYLHKSNLAFTMKMTDLDDIDIEISDKIDEK